MYVFRSQIMKTLLFSILAVPFAFCQEAQNPPPAAPTALPTPPITGPLSNLPPATFEAGPFGKLAVNGFLSGYGLLQNNHVSRR
jgi:hypothetical protein